jgi:hypothetical protein
MSADDGMRRSVAVHGTVVPTRNGHSLEEIRGTVSMAQDELYGPGFRWSGRRRMTWLEVSKSGRPQINIRLDRDQALTLAEAIVGPADGTGLLTRDQAIKRAAAMIQDWGITREELEAEQVIRALAGK